jgi:hypothetical protein
MFKKAGKGKIYLSIDIIIFCQKCGSEIEEFQMNPENNILFVDPCNECLNKAVQIKKEEK